MTDHLPSHDSGSHHYAAMARQVENLEIKASYMEDLLDELNLTIYRQQEQIDRLAREVVRLRDQAPTTASDGGAGNVDERPPHY